MQKAEQATAVETGTIVSFRTVGDGVWFLQGDEFSYGPAQPHYTNVVLTFGDGRTVDGVLWVDVNNNVSITGRHPRRSLGWADAQKFQTPERLTAETVRDMFRDMEQDPDFSDLTWPECDPWASAIGAALLSEGVDVDTITATLDGAWTAHRPDGSRLSFGEDMQDATGADRWISTEWTSANETAGTESWTDPTALAAKAAGFLTHP